MALGALIVLFVLIEASNACSNIYTTKNGDGCYRIAELHQLSLYSLLSLNPNLDCNNVRAGQRICVPKGSVSLEPSSIKYNLVNCGTKYVIQSRDSTCSSLVSQNRISWNAFYELNPGIDCSNLRIGNVVCMPTVVQQSVTKIYYNVDTCGLVYQVRSGDVCQTICNYYRLQLSQFYQLNPEISCESLHIGDRVCVMQKESNAVSIADNCGKAYVIRYGDTCTSVCNTFRITWNNLAILNPQIDCAHLRIGDNVCIMNKVIQPVIRTCNYRYIIRHGDSCDALCRDYRITWDTFSELNPTINCASLHPGDYICTPFEIIPTTTTTTTTTRPPPTIIYRECGVTYVIRRGDDCARICNYYHLDHHLFYNLNPGLNCEHLPIGQTICISRDRVIQQHNSRALITVSNCNNKYVIRSDDSCQRLLDYYKLDRNVFYRINPSIECKDLRIGDEVCLARYESSQRVVRCANTYIVRNGDSCNSICSQYSLSQNYFYRLNPGIDCHHLNFGDYVCIPVKQIEYSPVRITTPERTYSYRYDTCGSTYTIRIGDDCTRICNSYHLEYNSFITLNPGLNCEHLSIGQTVCVSEKIIRVQTHRQLRKVYNCDNVYTIRDNNDSCGNICGNYKITSETFYRLNPQINCNDIRVGDEICVPALHQYPDHAFGSHCGFNYVVRLGDTCNAICNRYRLQLQDFYTLNPSIQCPLLRAGQSICLSSQEIQHRYVNCKNYYVVRSGNNCESIARMYHVAYDKFIQLNSQISCSSLTPGQSVCVSGQYY